MALPPLPENNTDRLFIKYTTGGGTTAQEHTMGIRFNAAIASPSDIMLDIADALGNATNEGQLFSGWQVLSAEVQAEGAAVRLPVAVPAALLAILGTGGSGASQADQAREVRFVGRGLTSGRKVTLSIYGIIEGAIREPDFRFEPPSGDLLFDLGNTIRGIGLTGAAYSTIAGDATNWYEYVNWQYNSHWESEQRS